MKNYILLLLIFSMSSLYSSISPDTLSILKSDKIQTNNDRKLSDEEVKQRGIDLLVTEIVEDIDEIDLRRMARSAIFETSYGFRWKMVNLATGKVLVVKVDKDFELISARKSSNDLN